MLFYFDDLDVNSFLESVSESLEIIFNKFKDKDELFVSVNNIVDSISFKVRIRIIHQKLPDNVRVLKLFKECNFSDGSTWDTFIFRFQTDLFQGK